MVDTQTLQAYLKARGWSRSELARRVGVSRQAVSLWFQGGGTARLRGDHLLGVGKALGVPVEDLARPLPVTDDGGTTDATLLWDSLYPDLLDFAIAAGRFEPKAVGRLVEVYGLYATARILGPSVWKKFEHFKRFIHPARRRQLETIVQWRRSRTAS